MSTQYYRRTPPQRPKRRGRGCLVTLVVLVWVVLLGILGWRFWVQPRLSAYISDQISQQVDQQTNQDQINSQIQQGLENSLPTIIAALPTGELVISEADANAFLAAQSAQMRPLDSIQVRFVPNEIQADLSAFGFTSTAYLSLALQNGRVIAINPRLDGMLGQFLSLSDLTNKLEPQFNNLIEQEGLRVSDLRLEQGRLVLTIER